MAKELSVNKNTQEIYEFYKTKLIDHKSLKGKNVLVLELGNITYIDEIKKYAKNVCVIDRAYNCFFGDVFENINTLEIQIKNFLEKNKMPKFDIAIMNPPYDGDLHISILKYVKSKSKKTINISPNWFYDYKKNYEIKPNTIQDLTYTESVNLFDGIQLQYPLAITTYEEDNNKFANTKKYVNEAYTLFSKIKLNTTLDDVNSKDYNGKGFFVPLKLMTSFWDNNKNFILDKLGVLSNGKTLNGNFYKDERRRNKNRPCGGIYQKTFNEAKNLADSFNTTFYVKWVKTFHTNTRYILTEYPYMDDYTKPWTNQRFCEYFFGKKDEKGNYLPNPGGFISDTQAIPGSEWDIILKS